MTSVTECDSPIDNEPPTATEDRAAEATTPEATEHVPLWQRIGDMFPEVKPQQSMAAWDDDTPF